MSNLELYWGQWVAEALYLALLALLLVLTGMESRKAYRIEGRRAFFVILLIVPWVVDIFLGYTHEFGERRGGPAWVGQAIDLAAIANPVLWVAALITLRRSWRFVLPFVAFNIFVAPLAIIYSSCSWAGACF
jgi:hypothetical protein